MRNAIYKRQPDGSVLCRMVTKKGPCDLFMAHAEDNTVQLYGTCPRLTPFELFRFTCEAFERINKRVGVPARSRSQATKRKKR